MAHYPICITLQELILQEKEEAAPMTSPHPAPTRDLHATVDRLIPVLEARRIEQEFSVKALSERLSREGLEVSRHRLSRLMRGETPLSFGDAVGLGRVLYKDETALFRIVQ